MYEIRLAAAYKYSVASNIAASVISSGRSSTIASAVSAIAGPASNQAIQFTDGLLLTTHTASGTTTSATAPNSTRPVGVSSISGYSSRLSSCAASSNADGCRL